MHINFQNFNDVPNQQNSFSREMELTNVVYEWND